MPLRIQMGKRLSSARLDSENELKNKRTRADYEPYEDGARGHDEPGENGTVSDDGTGENGARVDDESHENEQNCPFIKLPDEILIHHIFKPLLELEDRKNIRLTCHFLYEKCHHPAITGDEKLVIHRYNEKNLANYIPKYDWTRNFEFHKINLKEYPSFWEDCGRNIQSLMIYCCDLDDSVFKNIVIHCRNLTHFLCSENVKKSYSMLPEFLSEDVTNELLALKIERKKLISFEVYGYKFHPIMTNRIWKKLFQIYPCIRTFGEKLINENSMKCSAEKRVDEYLAEYLKALKNFGSEWQPCGTWEVFPANVKHLISNRGTISAFGTIPTSRFRLKTLSIDLYYTLDDSFDKYRVRMHGLLEGLIMFFSNQTELEALKLDIRGYPDMNLALLNTFTELTELKELEFNTTARAEQFSKEMLEIFQKLTNQLKSLKFTTSEDNYSRYYDHLIEIPFVHNDEINAVQLLPQERHASKLRKLCLQLDRVGEEFAFKILKQCWHESLEYLELTGFLITKYFVDKLLVFNTLRTLRVSFESEHRPELSSTFKNLQNLALTIPIRSVIDISLISQTLPRNLKCLLCTLPLWMDDNMDSTKAWLSIFDIISTYSPDLEILKIEIMSKKFDSNAVYESLPIYFERLTRLRVMMTSIFVSLDDEKLNLMKKLFTVCPSLRWINDLISTCYYSFNRSSGEVVSFSQDECFKRTMKYDPFEPILDDVNPYTRKTPRESRHRRLFQ